MRPVALVLFALACSLGAWPQGARAQDEAAGADPITLAEIVPALDGTELGALVVGDAPPPGALRVVRRAEVLAALARAGRGAEGLVIPRETRIRREARTLSREEIASAARSVVVEALAPCQMSELVVRAAATVPAGEVSFEALGPARPAGTRAVVTILVRSGGHTVRVTAQAEMTCPEPVVAPGSHVSVVIAVGAVRASADGVCRQSGRVGDVVRVHVETTDVTVQARVIDEQTVEVIR